jgi:hypothetical protein
MARPSLMLLGRPVVFSMPVTTTHQKGADSEGIQMLRATITILTEWNAGFGYQRGSKQRYVRCFERRSELLPE